MELLRELDLVYHPTHQHLDLHFCSSAPIYINSRSKKRNTHTSKNPAVELSTEAIEDSNMDRFLVALAFILASMLAISAAHAGRPIDEGRWLEYGVGSKLVGSNGGKWSYGVDSLELGVKEAAGGPAAAAAVQEPEQGFAFVHRKIWDHHGINCYKKVPITGF